MSVVEVGLFKQLRLQESLSRRRVTMQIAGVGVYGSSHQTIDAKPGAYPQAVMRTDLGYPLA